MRFLPALALALLMLIVGCARGSEGNPLCTCAEGEKFDGNECVAAADFTPSEIACTDDGQQVCGCDETTYTSSCAAQTAGVQVQYGGPCNTTTLGSGNNNNNNNNNNGGGFGW
jgi:hypothetical protein